MKRFAKLPSRLLSLLMVLSFILVASPALAQLTTTYDLITWDTKTQIIEEPDGKVKITLKLPKGVKEKHYQVVYEKGALPVLQKYRKDLKKSMMAIDDKLESDSLTEKEAKKLLKYARSVYKEAVKGAIADAEKGMQKEWNKIKKSNSAYSKFKLKVGLRITKGVVGLVKSIAALVGSGGTALPEYYSAVKSCISIVKEVRKAAMSEAKAKKKLEKALANLLKNKSGKKNKKAVKRVKKALSLYDAKVGKTKKKAFSLTEKIHKSMDQVQKDKGDKEKKKKFERALDQMIKKTIALNESAESGRELVQKAGGQVSKPDRLKATLDRLKDVGEIANGLYALGKEIKSWM